jgi:hypothetical protein
MREALPRRGGDPAAPRFTVTDPHRRDRAWDVAAAFLAAGVLLGLPVLTWVLGIY